MKKLIFVLTVGALVLGTIIVFVLAQTYGDIVVTGAGADFCNGTYVYLQQTNNKPEWEESDLSVARLRIVWMNSSTNEWWIVHTQGKGSWNKAYYHVDNTPLPPRTGWEVGPVLHYPPAPTLSGDGTLPVELASFSAQVTTQGVQLQWVTESEVDNLGFHIYRSLAENGHYECVTSELIAGAGNTSTKHTYSFTDRNIDNGITYWYKLEDVAIDGTTTMHGPISVTPMAEGNELAGSLPTEFGLSQNFPNPFNPKTEICYQLPEASQVVLAIYDGLGRKVRVLVNGLIEEGFRSVVWDAENSASGIYFVCMEAGNFVKARKIVLVR